MRLLMLNNEFPPLGGGTGTVNLALLRRFAQVPTLEIDLITSALGRQHEQMPFAERVNIFKVPVRNRNIHHSTNRELLAYAAQALPLAVSLHRRRQYDFCFAWSTVPAGGVALALRRLIGLKYLVRVCGPDIPGFERRYQGIYQVLTPTIRRIWRGAAAVVAKCDGEAQMIRAVAARVPVTQIANGVDLAAFQPSAKRQEAGPLRLLCVARLIERKGQHHLIAAIKRLADAGVAVQLNLVGTGDAQAANEAQARELGIDHLVRFVGYVPRADIAAHYQAAHVFVLPSYNEGMSVATLEALAAGLPVIVTRTGGTAELVREGANGLTFDWADIDTLAAHIRQLAEDRSLVQQMGSAARLHAAHFSWDSAAQHYLHLFDRLNPRAGASARSFARDDSENMALPLKRRGMG